MTARSNNNPMASITNPTRTAPAARKPKTNKTKPMKAQLKSRIPRHLALLLAMLAFPALAPAQTTAPQPPGPLEIDSEIVILPTFQVVTDKDIGYIAVDALAGGRTSTPIRLTPSAMSSLTRTFLDDVGVTNIRDALDWSLNVRPAAFNTGRGGFPFNTWDFNFRGSGQSIQGGAGPTRNYFTFYQVADSYNVERIEFDRGPNSILFGIGTIGGVLNIYTKQPRADREFITAAATIDSNAAWRFEADINKNLRPNFTFRLNALLKDDRGWQKNVHVRQAAVNLAGLWKISDRTRIRFDAEASTSKNTVVQNVVGEQVSLWDGATIADTAGTVIPNPHKGVTGQEGWGAWYETPPGGEEIRHPPETYWVYQPGNPSAGLQNYVNSYRTTGSGRLIAPYSGFYKGTLYNPDSKNDYPDGITLARIPTLPSRDFTFSSGIARPIYANITVWLEHQFTRNLDAVLSFYRYTDDLEAINYEGIGNWTIDINKQLPDGTSNPNFGKPYGDFFLSKQRQARAVTEGRLQVNWQFEKEPLRQRFSLGAGIQRIDWAAWQFNAINTTNPVTRDWSPNLVWSRLYATNPNVRTNIPGVISGKTIVYSPMTWDWFDFDETHDITNVSAVSHSRLWDDHLSVIAGIRYDDYEYKKTGRNTGSRDKFASFDTTYTVGAVYYVHGLPWLGVFGNYSRNFNPVKPGSSPKLDGTHPSATTGEGRDFGIRISTKDGKYYASFSRYEGKVKDMAANTILGFKEYWKPYFTAAAQTVDEKLTTMEYSDVQSLETKGWEFEVTANPLPSLRIMASLALPDAEFTNALSGQRAYYNEHIAQWQQAVTDGRASGDQARVDAANTLSGKLTDGKTKLDANAAGKKQTKLVDYTANIFANYTFLEGRLKGFAVGAGATMFGKQYLTIIRDRKWYADSRITTNLVLAYSTKIFGKETRLALNVDNLLNKRDAIITDFDGGWRYADGSPVPSGFWLPSPITFRLSARVTF